MIGIGIFIALVGMQETDSAVIAATEANETASAELIYMPAGLAIWLRGDKGITTVTGVSNWADLLSGVGRAAAQATTSKQPAFSASGGPNSKPCVTGDGLTNTMKVTGGFTLTQPEHVFHVGKFTNAFAANEDFYDGNAGNSMRFRRNNTTHMVMSSSGDLANSGYVTLTSWHYYTNLFKGSSGSQGRQDGTLRIGPGNSGTTSAGGLTLFTFGDGASDPCAGSIAEILVFAAELSNADRDSVEAYLAARYAL